MKILRSKEALVDLCKENGTMLFTAPGEAVVLGHAVMGERRRILRTDQIEVDLEEDPERKLGKTVCQLLRAVASDLSLGLAPEGTEFFVPQELLEVLNNALQNEQDPIRRVSSYPVVRTFVCLDVSDFSKTPSGQQSLIVRSLSQLIKGNDWYLEGIAIPPQLEAQLCIGDGYIYVCKDPLRATYFGSRLAYLIDRSVADRTIPVEFHYRIGIHVGEVYTFWDPGRDNWNYIGDGINGATRILQAIGKDMDDVVYVSGAIREHFLGNPEENALLRDSDGNTLYEVMRDHLDNKGRRLDKHGNTWRVYQVNHTKIATTPEAWST